VDLIDFGWKGPSFPPPPQGKPDCSPARVVEEQKGGYYVASTAGELWAETAGRLRFDASSRAGLPVVGDWVWIHPSQPGRTALIHGILPRTNCLSRLGLGRDKAAGDEEPLAANVDVMLIVTALNKEFKASRLERYGTLAWENGIQPVVLLNKADLCGDAGPFVAETRAALPGAVVLTLSALKGDGVEKLSDVLAPRSTAILLGSSGVGKSTLINTLMDLPVQDTGEARADDDRGRHTTTTRSLLRLPSGALLIDTPGLREVAFAQSADGIGKTFADIEELSVNCRFHDCSHGHEPGCAVQEALRAGRLSERRHLNYQKLLKEQAHLKSKTDTTAALKQKADEKKLSRRIKTYFKQKDEQE
jgi:ribosome biogenesis GTPase